MSNCISDAQLKLSFVREALSHRIVVKAYAGICKKLEIILAFNEPLPGVEFSGIDDIYIIVIVANSANNAYL